MLFDEYMATYRPFGGLTAKECRIAGIPYPLISGWRKQAKTINLSEAQVAKMLTGISKDYQTRIESRYVSKLLMSLLEPLTDRPRLDQLFTQLLKLTSQQNGYKSIQRLSPTGRTRDLTLAIDSLPIQQRALWLMPLLNQYRGKAL